ncbi:MAG: hypothetical protein K2M64_02490 [Clostridia bacterium]|nr:hypothetical protein [Clostridia bacterium]
MKSETNHIFATELESREGLACVVEEDDMLCDIKKLLSEYYLATFSYGGKELNVSFNNGQKFSISVKETTKKSA